MAFSSRQIPCFLVKKDEEVKDHYLEHSRMCSRSSQEVLRPACEKFIYVNKFRYTSVIRYCCLLEMIQLSILYIELMAVVAMAYLYIFLKSLKD